MAKRLITANLDSHFRQAQAGRAGNTALPASVSEVDMPLPKMLSMRDPRHSSFSPFDGASGMMEALATRSVMGADIKNTAPEITNPLLNVTNFYLPQDRRVLLQWQNYYSTFHPMVGTALDLKAEVPVSQFNFTGVDDPFVNNVYEDVADRVNMHSRTMEIIREYFKSGETILFQRWNETEGIFDQLIPLNPAYVHITGHPFAYDETFSDEFVMFALEPDPMLRFIIRSNDEQCRAIKSYIDPVIIRAVEQNRLVPVESFYMSWLARRESPYDFRGTSIINRILKDLLYEDKLRGAQYAIADRLSTPMMLAKLGNEEFIPEPDELDAFRQLILESVQQPTPIVIGHSAYSIDYVGASGKSLPIVPEMQFIEDRILTGLMLSKAMTHGEGPNFSVGQVGWKTFMASSLSVRQKVVELYKKKVFAPIAAEHGFVKRTEAEISHRIRTTPKTYDTLMLPDFNWMGDVDLINDTQQKQMLLNLFREHKLPFEFISKIFNMDYKGIEKGLIKEQMSVFDPLYEEVRKKALQAGTVKPTGSGLGEGMGGGELGGEAGGEAPEAAPEEAETIPEEAPAEEAAIEPLLPNPQTVTDEYGTHERMLPPREPKPRLSSRKTMAEVRDELARERTALGPFARFRKGDKPRDPNLHEASKVQSKQTWNMRFLKAGCDGDARRILMSLESEIDSILADAEKNQFESLARLEDTAVQPFKELLGSILNPKPKFGSAMMYHYNYMVDHAVKKAEAELRAAGLPVSKEPFEVLAWKNGLMNMRNEDLVSLYNDTMSNVSGSSVNQVIAASLKQVSFDIPDERDALLRKMFGHFRGVLKSQIRNAAWNDYQKTKLAVWNHHGIKKARRTCVHDEQECDACKALEGSIYPVGKLLKLDMVVLDNPDNKMQRISHMDCQCGWQIER